MTDRSNSTAVIGRDIRDQLRKHAQPRNGDGLKSILVLLILLAAVACLFLIGRVGR